jgi:dipeptidyl aminopeptidase/acylaminoacyl peptidase
MNNLRVRFAAVLCCVTLLIIAADAASHPAQKSGIEQAVNSLFTVQDYDGAVISPDGQRVAWVEVLKKNGVPTGTTAIYVRSVSATKVAPKRVTAGNGVSSHTETDLAWSPDGSRIAFLSDASTPGQAELYIAPAAGGPARKLTQVKGFLSDPEWSPDGRSIAILFTENAPRASGPLEPMTPQTGVIEDQIYEQRLAIIDVATARLRQLTPADLYVYEYNWAPDGKRFAATAAHGSGDNNWWIAELYTIDAGSGDTRSIMKPPASLQLAVPRWSSDGNSIAFIGGLMSDAGATGGDIYAVPASGGEPKNLTPGMKASASWIDWLPKSNRILFSEHVDGHEGYATVNPETGHIDTLWTGDRSMSSGGFAFYPVIAKDEKSCALIIESFSTPPEVWAGALGSWKQITNRNSNQRPSWGEAKNIHWTSDGARVQGWLVYPRDFDPNRRYPMVVVVHGGPASLSQPRWPGSFFGTTLLASQGYFVLYPNPRGSYGQGEDFTRGNVKDFGYGDLRDILAGVDEAVHTLPIDDNRVGITGWSYGGFMTMWAITQTNRFHAAVSGAGLSDWLSYYGQNDIDQWMIPYFGASVYDDPQVYAKSSPINYIKNVKTPTLILVGDRDGECPAPQSFEYWHALKTLGVKNQFVVYEGEGHHIYKPNDQRDIMSRMLAWFNKELGGAG